MKLQINGQALRFDLLKLGNRDRLFFGNFRELESEGLQNALWELGGIQLKHPRGQVSSDKFMAWRAYSSETVIQEKVSGAIQILLFVGFLFAAF